MARLLIHRYTMLGVLDKDGYPVTDLGVLESPAGSRERAGSRQMKEARCRECGNLIVIRKDGGDFCSACGSVEGVGEMCAMAI